MKRKKIIPDPILMVVSILFLTAFQLYWLKQNYSREKKSLAMKTEFAFRQTIMTLQVSKLNLDSTLWNDSTANGPKMKVFMKEGDGPVKVRFKPKEEIISTIDLIRNKMNDTPKTEMTRNMVISVNKSSMNISSDSISIIRNIPGPGKNNRHIFNLLYNVDSLQDSLRLSEIDSAYSAEMKKQSIIIPFSIIKKDSADNSDDDDLNKVTVGFAHPITYQLSLGNTFPYLMKQIAQPILFSVLLLGITILSFVLLYKNLLRQRRLAELKNEFISNITHELKTPIATVGVAIEALKNFNAIQNPERTKEYLDISSNELQRLSLLVDKVLKLSMFEKKEMELKYEPVSLKSIVEEVVESLKLQFEKHHAKVTVADHGDTTLQADRLHMLSVVFNLLDNALKYSKEEPVIYIDLQEKENAIILSVTDNGIGIADEYKNKVFDKFFRIPHGDTHNAKGYGLGLSYTAQVIEKHKGTIVIESQPDNGVKFTITLPKQQG